MRTTNESVQQDGRASAGSQAAIQGRQFSLSTRRGNTLVYLAKRAGNPISTSASSSPPSVWGLWSPLWGCHPATRAPCAKSVGWATYPNCVAVGRDEDAEQHHHSHLQEAQCSGKHNIAIIPVIKWAQLYICHNNLKCTALPTITRCNAELIHNNMIST